MPHKLCRSFHLWCPGVKTRCLFNAVMHYDILLTLVTPGIYFWHLRDDDHFFDQRTAQVYWDAIFFGQPGNVSKFSPFLWVKLWVGWVGRGYIEINRYFPALWINRVTLVTKIKHWYSLGYYITFESPKCLYGMRFCVSKPDSIFSVYHSSPSSHVRSSLIGWSFILGNTDCNTVPTWWM